MTTAKNSAINIIRAGNYAMRSRLDNTRIGGYKGTAIGYSLGLAMFCFFSEAMMQGGVLANWLDQQEGLSLSDPVVSAHNGGMSLSQQSIDHFEVADLGLIFPAAGALIGAITGTIIGNIWPVHEELEDAADTIFQEATPLELPVNKLQEKWEKEGYQGDIPMYYRDPVFATIMDNPYVLLTERCSTKPFTARSYNYSTISTLEKYDDHLCPVTRDPFIGSIPNVELKQAIHAWFKEIKASMEGDPVSYDQNKVVPSYYLDPLTNELMQDPYIVLPVFEDGKKIEGGSLPRTYDLSTIQADKVRETRKLHKIIPNRELKESIQDAIAKDRFGFFGGKKQQTSPANSLPDSQADAVNRMN